MSETGGGRPGPSRRGKRPGRPADDIGRTLMQLPAVLESMSDGFVAVSRDWRYTYVNAAAARLLRQPAYKLVGTPVFEAFPEARGTAFEEGFRTALEQNVATTFEAHYAPLGAWFECRCHPGSDGISVFFTDITQRKGAEEALRRSERLAKSRLREIETIYNSVHVGLCVFDRKLRFIRINERLAEINGIPAAHHIGKTVREVLPNLADTTEELAERIFRTGEPVLNFELSGVTAARPGVMRHWVEHWLPLKTDSGRVVGINVVVHEVTQQKEAEKRLAYLASFPQRSPNPIMELDSDGDIRFMNPAAMRLFPDLAERGISHPWLANWGDVVAPFREVRTETGIRDVTIGERTYQQAFYYSQEGFVRIYGFDITDREQARTALQEANEHLQAQAEELQTQTEELQMQTEELQAQQEELQMQAEELTTANEELRESEQALRQSEARYRSLAENMPSVLMRYDSELRVVYLSPKAQEITGVPIDQFIGKTNRQVGMPDDLCSLWENAIGEVFRTGRDRDLEFSFPSPEGPKTFYLKLASEFGSDGAVTHVLGISTDITERKRAEQKLAEENSEIALANRVLQVFVEETGEDLFDKALQIVMEATESRHGIFGYIDENGDLVCPSMSKLLDECEVTNKCIRYPQGKWKGLWSRALQEKQTRYTNEAPIVPKGHVPIRNNLAAPILFHNRVIGLLNLANKETEYTEADRELIESIANRVAPVLYAWVQRELRETEREQAEQKLAEQAFLLANVGDAIIGFDLDYRITFWGAAAERMYGYTEAEAVGQSGLEILQPVYVGTTREEALAQLMNTGHLEVEFIQQTKSGRKLDIDSHSLLLRNDKGEPCGIVAVNRDITERKAAEQALRDSEERYRLLVETATEGLWQIDTEFRTVYVNARMAQMLGYTPEEMAGRHIRQFMAHDEMDDVGRRSENRRLGIAGTYERELLRQDGSTFWALVSAAPLRDPTGRVTGSLGLFTDITERKRAEEALQKAHEDLQVQSEELAAANEELQAQSEELQTANEELREQELALQESLHQTQRTAERLNLLSDTAASLLASEEPQIIVESLCQAVMKFLDCQAFFNFLVDEQAGRLRLNACAGIPKRDRKKIEWLDFGTAVCGCVARDGQRIVAEHIPGSDDERTTLVKSYGIKAYACHPIIAGFQVLGTLSFGTKTRETFGDDELSLIRAVTDMVALAVQRQQTRQALSDSELRYRNLFERMNEGFGLHEIICDDTGQPCDYRFLDVNPAFEQLTGLKRENVVGRLVSEVLPDNDPYWVEAFGRVALTGEPIHIEQYSTPLQRHYDVYAYRPAPGQFAVVFMDITQRRLMEAELRRWNEQLEEKVAERTEQLTRSIDRLQDEMTRRVLAEGKLRKHSRMLDGFFQHTITPLAFLDCRFNFVQVNEAYANVEKKDPKYFVGKNHFELYPHEENQAIFEQVVRTKQPYRAYAKPFTYPDDPQRVTYWDWRLTPLLSEFGDVQFLVLNLADVTEQQKAFQELERRARQLQHLTLELSQAEDRERRRLAEILHDDLQQLLAAAKFHLGILGSRIKDNESAREIAGQISQMLRDAIDQSRSLSHELSPGVLYEGDLGETFEWLAQQVQSKHGLIVHVEAHGRIESRSDALRAFLYRTAQEMLFNVVKHAKANEARLRLRHVRGRIWMTISDQGQGFDPRTLSRSAGFGLLSIRERVELLGGRMRIRSAAGRGSTFLIAVPDTETQTPSPHETRTEQCILNGAAKRERADSTGVKLLRVLLVDDHEVMREGLAILLGEQEDMEVVAQAGNGREAVDLASRLAPDIVVMDASMPVMAGDEATRQIKQLLPNTRIIALSMFEESRMAGKMRKAGAEAYLLKTAPSDQLLAAIRGKHRPGP